MKTILVTVTGVLASALPVGSTFAQSTTATSEVTVQASRATQTTVGTGANGAPIQNVSLSYGVSTAGLDLSTQTGKAELEKRISNAAMAACKQLGLDFPASEPSDSDCAKAATKKAMAQVRQLETAAAKKQ